ncbi:MAG TPA: response regulator [Mariprofundaceae bacterium]|nr:response regulator [Mariprofundaceae bacterium]
MMQRWTVMLVDDEAMVLQVHGRFFECMGHDVDMYTHPLKAAERFRDKHHAIDLLVTDFKMPDMDGLELVRTARANGYAGPVLMFTGYDQGAHVDTGARLGVDVMCKPVRYYELVEYVRHLQQRPGPFRGRRPGGLAPAQ